MKYEAECGSCGFPFDYASTVEDCMMVPPCPVCARPARKAIRTAPMGLVIGKFEPFKSMVDGSLIQSQHDLKEHNRRNRVVNLNDGYSEERVVSGMLHQRPKDTAVQDIIQSIQAVEGGYKPRVHTDD